MTALYTPPTWRNVGILEGALRAGVTTCTVVWRQGGVWSNTVTADMNVLPDVDPSGLVLLFTRPTVIPSSLVAEMTANAITPADPAWTPGTIV
jgi:hypothetical protein